MLYLILSSMIITAQPGEPTEIIGSAATPEAGVRKEVTVEQPENAPNSFGYIAPEENYAPQSEPEPKEIYTPQATPPTMPTAATETLNQQHTQNKQLLVNQEETVDPKDLNPLDYENKIENTIYQQGDRLIDVQSIPLKDISSAVQPNLQPVITDYPNL